MPNWCDNRLHISGDIETIKTFIEKVRNTKDEAEKRRQEFDILGNLYPTPQELRDATAGHFTAEPNANWANLLAKGDITQEWHDELVERNAKGYATAQANRAKYGYADWYDWNCANWGTKWGDSDTFIVDEEPFVTPDGRAHIEFGFQSAWSPPIEGIAHIATMFPTLEFGLAYYEEGMDFYGFTTFIDGDPIDNCEQISDIDGMAELEALMDNDDSEIDVWEKRNDLICEARDRLMEEAGF